MIETKQSLDVKAAVASLKTLITHDGNYIVVDPSGVSASGSSQDQAKQEVQRRKAAQEKRFFS